MTKFSAIVLAAGLSSRMEGAHKLLMPIQGKTIFERSMKSILEVDFSEVIVVLGKESEKLQRLIQRDGSIKTVYNAYYESGMTSSIQAGIKEATGAVYVICLADMPFLLAEDYLQLMNRFNENNGKDILVPLFKGQKGNPVLFANVYKNEILAHTDPNGCQQIVKRNTEKVDYFETNNLRFTLDIDIKTDLEKWFDAQQRRTYTL
ncbi:nucleotidyltransferase family protein [Roseivirga echinicomitans]